MTKRSPYARFYAEALRDPDVVSLIAVNGDRGLKAIGHFVLVLAHLKDVKAKDGTTTHTSRELARRLYSKNDRSLRDSIRLISEACESNGHEPFMELLDDGRIRVRNFEQYQSTGHGGARTKPPPDAQLDPNLNTNTGSWYSESISHNGGECEGGDDEPPDWNQIPASYAAQKPDHPFNRAWEAWPKQVKIGQAKAAWTRAVVNEGAVSADRLLTRILAYTESRESRDAAGTQYHPPLHDWIRDERYNDTDEHWNRGDGSRTAKSDRDSRTMESPEQRQLRAG